jgi:hypothetical protein
MKYLTHVLCDLVFTTFQLHILFNFTYVNYGIMKISV